MRWGYFSITLGIVVLLFAHSRLAVADDSFLTGLPQTDTVSTYFKDVAANFSNLDTTRGTFVDSNYSEIVEAITKARQCVNFSLTNFSEHPVKIGPSIIHANPGTTFQFSLQKRNGAPPYCRKLKKFALLNISGAPSNPEDTPFIPVRLPLEGEFFVEKEDETFAVAAFADRRKYNAFSKAFSVVDTKDNVGKKVRRAKVAVLTNQLKAIAIESIGRGAEGLNGGILWVRDANKTPKGLGGSPDLAAWVKASLHPKEALLFLAWKDGKLESRLIGQGFSIKSQKPVAKAPLLQMVSELPSSLGISRLVANRAPKRINRGFTSTSAAPKTKPRPIRNALEHLGKSMIPAEFQTHLKDIENVQIIAPGELATLPFAALINPATQNYLAEDFAVSLLPDLVSLSNPLLTWHPDQIDGALVIGNPTTGKLEVEFTFPPLPGAQSEAKTVAQLWNDTALIGKSAQVESVAEMLGERPIIHIAAHGIADPKAPLKGSFLALSSDESDGRLTALSILGTEYRNPQLAVMSACQSGLGFEHSQGTIGLARAFYVGGVPRVAMSLWNVSDEATTKLMSEFHKALKQDPPARALQQAMIETKKHYPDPALWASFMMFGTPR